MRRSATQFMRATVACECAPMQTRRPPGVRRAAVLGFLMEPRTERARSHFAAAWEEEVRRSEEIHGDARAYEFFVRER